MNRNNLLLCMNFHEQLHSSTPMLESSYIGTYLPLLELLEKNPKVKIGLSFSGFLFNWLCQNKPLFTEKLKNLAKKRQVELLTGVFASPLLPLIPEPDILGQIKMQTEFIKKTFEYIPRGMLIKGHAWEPDLVSVLAEAGVEYILVDENDFSSLGLKTDNMSGFFVTEEHGSLLNVLPLKDESIAAVSPSGAIELSWNEKKIRELFKLISNSEGKVVATTFSDYFDEASPIGRIYLTATRNFDRNYLVKHLAFNFLHKKMLYVSNKLQLMKRSSFISEDKNNEERLRVIKSAEFELYAGQADVLPKNGSTSTEMASDLGAVLYGHLIKSENLIDNFNRKGHPYVDLSVMDFDKDGSNEALLSNRFLNIYISPHLGGSIFELDYRPKNSNIINTVDFLQSDGPQGLCLIDHLISGKYDAATALKEKYLNRTGFEPDSFKLGINKSMTEGTVKLSRDLVVNYEGLEFPLKLTKTITIFSGQSIVNICYEVENFGDYEGEFSLATELNLSLADNEGSEKVFDGTSLKLIDAEKGFSVTLKMKTPGELFTVSPAKKGKRSEKNSVLVPSWKFGLSPGAVWSNKLSIVIEE